MDLDIDGVPLPADVKPLDSTMLPVGIDRAWSGIWMGCWGSWLKTLLVIESVSADGTASCLYAIGANPGLGIEPVWSRCSGHVEGGRLVLSGGNFQVVYDVRSGGRLQAVYGDQEAHAVMRPTDLQAFRGGSLPRWLGGEQVFLATDPDGTGETVRLETILYRPDGAGPFPLAIVNHGSTGNGTDPSIARQTRTDAGMAAFLADRGWLVAFPHRRGRGQSEGLYDEGFGADRSRGYTDEPDRSLAGADRALNDIAAAVTSLQRRPDVSDAPILITGQSRGGILSVAYTGRHPDQVAGVINFVGGWVGDPTPRAPEINGRLFGVGTAYPGKSLWLYGEGDIFYSMDHCRENHARFVAQGGRADFHAIPPRHAGNGHHIMEYPPLWEELVAGYLDAVTPGIAR